MDTTESRLARLERSMRRWRAGFALACVAALAAAGWGAAKARKPPAKAAAEAVPEEIKARSLLIVDERGRVVIGLASENDSVGSSVQMYRAGSDEPSVMLSVNDDGASVQVNHGSKAALAALAADELVGASVTVADKGGTRILGSTGVTKGLPLAPDGDDDGGRDQQ
jgi:hypothetical protein